jgi:BirA family biotin operon repressor/biotin-[acetyl-CoA-carboxylase] ligase
MLNCQPMMHPLTFPILRLLADGRFHSGEAIAAHFDVTRTTVWSAMQSAEALGVRIFSVRGRGYRLPDAFHLLQQDEILQAIGPERAWFQLELHDSLPSTNSYLIKRAPANLPDAAAHATCVVAQLQTAGKGRRGRQWQSTLGAGLTFSLLWRFQLGAAALSGLSLAIGVGLVRALHGMGLPTVRLKWPNDVLVIQQGVPYKLAGILIELQGDMEGPSAAVIGVGLNLNLPEQAREQIDQPATDLFSLMGEVPNPNLVLGQILRHLSEVLRLFEQSGFAALRDEWLAYHALHQQPVRLLMPDGREQLAQVTGVGEDGILLVQTAQGEQRFSAGDISLRGLP